MEGRIAEIPTGKLISRGRAELLIGKGSHMEDPSDVGMIGVRMASLSQESLESRSPNARQREVGSGDFLSVWFQRTSVPSRKYLRFREAIH